MNKCDKCNKWCCRLFNITLTDEEKLSRRYKIDNAFYAVSGQALLAKNEDGSCYYLDINKGCSIYEHRPMMCRLYDCERAGHKPNEYSPMVKYQSVQLRCLVNNCVYNNRGLDKCMNIAPAIQLYLNGDHFDCFSFEPREENEHDKI